MKNFRTYNLALELYRESRTLSLQSGVLTDQFERAILSVVLNLAEGSGRKSQTDQRRFYGTSLGSLREVQAMFDLAEANELRRKSDILGACIYKLIANTGGRP